MPARRKYLGGIVNGEWPSVNRQSSIVKTLNNLSVFNWRKYSFMQGWLQRIIHFSRPYLFTFFTYFCRFNIPTENWKSCQGRRN
jgi:hypothetical protein